MANDSGTHDDPRAEDVRLLKIFCVPGCFILALALRLIHYQQSLWADEMNTLLEFISGPWSKIVAPAAGEYVPNDHVLFSILAKLCFLIGGGNSRDLGSPMVAGLIRLPSLIAGSILPIALAWPMRRRTPLLAILVALFAAVNPWLIAFSDEARGYSLMILLGVIATNLLPDGTRRWPVGYAFAMAGAIYTVPVAGVLLIAHFLVVLLIRRKALGAWMRGGLMAGMLLLLLFAPMVFGIGFYYQHPMSMTADVGDLANQLPRFAMAGQYVPDGLDPLIHRPDAREGIFYFLIPVALLMTGTWRALKSADWRSPLVVMAAATLLFFVVGLVNPETAQVRFVPWCGVWLILSLAFIAAWLKQKWGSPAMVVFVAIIGGWFVHRDIVLLPSQPVREAMVQADVNAPPRISIVMALLTAPESTRLYGDRSVHQHKLIVAASPGEFVRVEKGVIEKTGERPWVVLSYEYMPHDFSPGFWDYFLAHYELQSRLPGRISAVGIYRPRGATPTVKATGN